MHNTSGLSISCSQNGREILNMLWVLIDTLDIVYEPGKVHRISTHTNLHETVTNPTTNSKFVHDITQ